MLLWQIIFLKGKQFILDYWDEFLRNLNRLTNLNATFKFSKQSDLMIFLNLKGKFYFLKFDFIIMLIFFFPS